MGSGARQAELWGPSAKLWAEKHEAYSLDLSRWALDHLLNGSAMHILDAGCGAGGGLLLAAARGAKVTGSDAAAEMIELCKQRLPQGDFHVADSEALPFADATFDAVMAINSLQFTETPTRALQEFARVSKPEANIGVVCFGDTAHSDFATVGAAVRKLFKTPPSFEGPFSLSPPDKLRQAIADAALDITESADIVRVREYEHFDEFWHGQSGTGATRYTVRELGEELVRKTMAAAMEQFTDMNGMIRLSNSFHAVICRKTS